MFDKCLFFFDKWLTSVGFALTNVCLLRDYDFYYSRLLGHDLACRVIYIVSILTLKIWHDGAVLVVSIAAMSTSIQEPARKIFLI